MQLASFMIVKAVVYFSFGNPMTRFYFHICDGDGRIPDDEGMDLQDMKAARTEVFNSARDLALTGIRSGLGIANRFVELEDEMGNLLKRLPFKSALHS